ncbi:MAG: flagellar biosynthesis protein [Dehalococcoidia bacterium]|nr:flagellar biosynthesis protein [Dehalococcoidia bacterium]
MAIDRGISIGPGPASLRPAAQPANRPGSSAGAAFQEALQQASHGIQFSRHAQKRVDNRDLNLDPSRLDRLNTAIDRAAQKGARNSVVMLDDLAVVVDINQRTVVTAMNATQGKERVFTNIDSVVIA